MTTKTARLDRLEKDAATKAAAMAAIAHDLDKPETWERIVQLAALDNDIGARVRELLDAARQRRDAYTKRHGGEEE